jgi:hypothetical protein
MSETHDVAQLRQKIAKLWYLMIDEGGYWELVRPNAIRIRLCASYLSIDHAWEQALRGDSVPDWPHDLGAAARLCIDVLDRLNATSQGRMWEFAISDYGVAFNHTAYGGGIHGGYSSDHRDAFGLSEIAWQALEALKSEHIP